jgi:SAM-dependent methyltransferase
LEVGCGTGVEAAWLAGRGFKVTAVDLSTTAIDRARERSLAAGVEVDLRVGSFPEDDEPFDFMFDFGCFHVFGEVAEREAFAQHVARCLRPGGRWLSTLGSTEGPPRDHGPPRRSALEIVSAVEPHLEILSLTDAMYDADLETPARSWVMMARRRA